MALKHVAGSMILNNFFPYTLPSLGLNCRDIRKTYCLQGHARSREREMCEFTENKNVLLRVKMVMWRDTHEVTSEWF